MAKFILFSLYSFVNIVNLWKTQCPILMKIFHKKLYQLKVSNLHLNPPIKALNKNISKNKSKKSTKNSKRWDNRPKINKPLKRKNLNLLQNITLFIFTQWMFTKDFSLINLLTSIKINKNPKYFFKCNKETNIIWLLFTPLSKTALLKICKKKYNQWDSLFILKILVKLIKKMNKSKY